MDMVFRIQLIGGEFVIVIPNEAMAALGLREGSAVEIVPLGMDSTADRYMTVEEGMAAYFATESQHRNTYRELAKGPGHPNEEPA